jgi:outer membrane protein assembly factor BamE
MRSTMHPALRSTSRSAVRRYNGAVLAALGALCMTAGLSGCALKNPFRSEPAAPQANPQTIAAANTGVQTFKERRFLGILSPYRPDIQQGNFVSREMVAQIKENMKEKSGLTQDQVRFVMGTPLVQDVFHKDRWDYPFRLEKGNGEVIASRVSLFFKDGRLVNVEGGDLPNEKDYISLIAGSAPAERPEYAPEKPSKK